MRREDVELAAALTEPVDQLHEHALRRLAAAAPMVGDPVSIWAESGWWNTTVGRITRVWNLDRRADTALTSQLGELITAVQAADDVARIGGVDAATRQRAMIDAMAVVRRRWASRARRIAVTETTRTLAEGMITGARGGDRKRWRSEHDDRVRASHREVDDNRAIPIMMPFLVGGYPMQYPGDPQAPVDEVANCRCGLEIVKGTVP